MPSPSNVLHVVIPSCRADNLIPCVRSILTAHPTWEPSRIIVVDDGARLEAEPELPAIQWIEGAKPFIFARNVNRGLEAAAPHDVIVMGDDAYLVSANGFDQLAEEARKHPDVAVCSAAIRGIVCNRNQQQSSISTSLRPESVRLAFVCVYLSRAALTQIGPLDERFIGYGYDDFDYCRRAREAGFRLAVWDPCLVVHADERSAYRNRPDISELLIHNRSLYESKWGDCQ